MDGDAHRFTRRERVESWGHTYPPGSGTMPCTGRDRVVGVRGIGHGMTPDGTGWFGARRRVTPRAPVCVPVSSVAFLSSRRIGRGPAARDRTGESRLGAIHSRFICGRVWGRTGAEEGLIPSGVCLLDPEQPARRPCAASLQAAARPSRSAAPWRRNGSRVQGGGANRYPLASVAGRDQPRRLLARECSQQFARGRVGRVGRGLGEEAGDPAGEIGVECAFARDHAPGRSSARGLERDAVAGSGRVPAVSGMVVAAPSQRRTVRPQSTRRSATVSRPVQTCPRWASTRAGASRGPARTVTRQMNCACAWSPLSSEYWCERRGSRSHTVHAVGSPSSRGAASATTVPFGVSMVVLSDVGSGEASVRVPVEALRWPAPRIDRSPCLAPDSLFPGQRARGRS